MKKRIISIILIVGLLAGMFSIGAAAASHPFTDVKAGAWYAGNVQYVYEKGLMAGTAPTMFSPNTKMDRAMLVTVLYRMDGSKAVAGSTPFTDIKTTEYYYKALVWAYQSGIISGTSPDKFSPSTPISREMMVAIFWRYANYLKLDTGKTANLSKFTDAGKISNYAKESFRWSVEAGIIAGSTPTTLDPKGTATRAECAAILERFGKWAENNTVVEPGPTPTEPTPTAPVHTHSYTSKVTKEATCTEDGVRTYTCSCGDSYTEVIPAAGHSWETVHHDEVGHWVSAIRCNCGWYGEGEDHALLHEEHRSQYSLTEQILYHLGYVDATYWVVDAPAHDTWVCSICGEVSDTEP